MSEQRERGAKNLLIEIGVHLVLMGAVVVALYPVLWVVTLALSPGEAPEARALPIPTSRQPRALRAGREHPGGGRDLALRRAARELADRRRDHRHRGHRSSRRRPPMRWLASTSWARRGRHRTLLATQMFPGVAASIPLYMLLHVLDLLDTRTGLILVYATTAVPFAIFQLRGAFEGIPRELEEAAMVDGATRVGAFVRVVLPAAPTGAGHDRALRVHDRLERVHPSGDLPQPRRAATRCRW